MLEGILVLLALGIAGGVIGYVIARLTIAILKAFKKKVYSKVLAIKMKKVVRELANDRSVPTYKLDELSDKDTMLIEYDQYDDKIVQANPCDTVDDAINMHMYRGNGVAVYE